MDLPEGIKGLWRVFLPQLPPVDFLENVHEKARSKETRCNERGDNLLPKRREGGHDGSLIEQQPLPQRGVGSVCRLDYDGPFQ